MVATPGRRVKGKRTSKSIAKLDLGHTRWAHSPRAPTLPVRSVERVRRGLEACGGRRAADILESLIAEVRAFADRPLDDLTIVVLRQLTEPVRGRTPGSQIALKLRKAPADTAR